MSVNNSVTVTKQFIFDRCIIKLLYFYNYDKCNILHLLILKYLLTMVRRSKFINLNTVQFKNKISEVLMD